MKPTLATLALAATLLLGAGCTEEPATAPALTLAPGLNISATQPRLRVAPTGITTATFEVNNTSSSAKILEYRTEWKNANGEVVESITGNWTTLRIEPADTRTVTITAPANTAEKPRIYLREYKGN